MAYKETSHNHKKNVTKQTQPAREILQRSIITVLLLIIFYPLGFLALWFWSRWPLWLKFILSIPMTIILILLVCIIALFAFNPSMRIKKAQCEQRCKSFPQRTYCVERCLESPYQ